MTSTEFARELVLFSVQSLSWSGAEKDKAFSASIENGGDASVTLFELAFLRGVGVWHALFAAKAREVLSDAEWLLINGKFLNELIQEFHRHRREDNPWKAFLSEIFEQRLCEYRESTRGADAIEGIKAMASLFARLYTGDPINSYFYNEALVILSVGTNLLVADVISRVKIVS